ncbi:hypothetical protein CR513_55984, partial [Mucuna pruriens]
MENNNRMLKELATSDFKSELIHLLPKFHNLAGEDTHKHLKEFHVVVGDTRRLHQDEGFPFLSRQSSKGLALPTASHVQHLGRYEAYVLGEILPNIQNCDHPEGNLWDQVTFKRDIEY